MNTTQEIIAVLNEAVSFIEHSVRGTVARGERRRNLLSAVRIVSGAHSYSDIRFELHGIVGLAMVGTRYAHYKERLFRREWRQFFQGGNTEHKEELLRVLHRIRDGVGELETLLEDAPKGWDFRKFPPELQKLSL